ncbi:MAG: ISAzo13 family transposase [Candidatus Hydrogenedentes bacterium]|nr:ISAzo13 family transposase [Candidatus Hydrogenedentota bacterium]
MDKNTEAEIAQRFKALEPFLDERLRRLAAAAEAQSLGARSGAQVSRATGVSRRAISQGLHELREQPPCIKRGRIRKPGGGRKRTVDTDSTLLCDLENLVDPVTRGDPMSALRWTCKSLRKLSEELCSQGHKVSHRMVAVLLHDLGYSLQANAKTQEGTSHPDRNAQFEHIHQTVQARLEASQPVVSVDTKKKELVGNFKNGGREFQPKGEPEEVRVHDFIIPELGRANPYGVYDLAHNEGWVSVGVDRDTAEFAVESIRRWWYKMGQPLYPDATRLLITADGGGSNGSRVRLWKVELQKLANELKMEIDVCHLPPGTSKWNKIEHRLFSFITQNWRGKPLVSHEVIVNLIAATTNKGGLKVQCALDTNTYATGIKISDKEMKAIKLIRDEFHGDWNYSIHPHQE